MKKKSKGEVLFYVILVISVLMVNPPILGVVNNYCQTHPLTWSYPTLWIWLEFWFGVMIVDFVIAAWKLKAWNCSQDQKTIVPVERHQP